MKFFVKRGEKVFVMSAPAGWLEQETQRIGGTFISNSALGNTANPLRLLVAAQTFLQAVKKTNPDIVACHSTIAGLIGRFALLNRIPTIFTAHGWSFTDGAKLYRRKFLPMIERLAARYCAKIICVSQNDLRLANKFKIAPEEKLLMIHNGVEIASSARNGLEPPRNDKIEILFIGRLAAPKDPFLLLDALPQDCYLTIIGDGPQKNQLAIAIKNLNIGDRVSLTGALSRDEVMKRLSTADIFVLPTRYEGLPYTILEAMAHGVPVVASDVGGVKETVGEDAGIVVPPDDVNALTHALDRLITHPELRQQMGETARLKVQNVFSVETMCQKTLDIYQKIR